MANCFEFVADYVCYYNEIDGFISNLALEPENMKISYRNFNVITVCERIVARIVNNTVK